MRAAADSSPAVWGVSHGSDVPFTFDHGDWVGTNSSFTPSEEAIATWLGAMWARFASGQPPTSCLPSTAADEIADEIVEATHVGNGTSATSRRPSRPGGVNVKSHAEGANVTSPPGGVQGGAVGGAAVWPRYDPAADVQATLMQSSAPIGGPQLRLERSVRAAACDLWVRLGFL